MLTAFRAFPNPFVYTLGWHLGDAVQNVSIETGYNQAVEDRLLESVDWRANGYALFSISALALSCREGWFSTVAESNCFALPKSQFVRLGGFSREFQAPGGGLVNLDFFALACAAPELTPVLLLGEGTFHQYHGGVATNVAMADHPWEKFHEEYRRVRGKAVCAAPVQPSLSRPALTRGAPIPSAQAMSAKDRRVVLVLGMHRSGTSALAGALHALGFGLPDNLLPPAPDNPGGYFESKTLTRLNEEILVAAGTSWHDPSPIPPEWFESAAALAFRERAAALVEKALAASPMIVLKDPRLCRLLPFWRACLTELEVAFGAVLILRDPREVARSLQLRVLNELTRPGGPLSIARAHWLWLRYVLEAEHGSRDLPRALLTYEMLLADGPASAGRDRSASRLRVSRPAGRGRGNPRARTKTPAERRERVVRLARRRDPSLPRSGRADCGPGRA